MFQNLAQRLVVSRTNPMDMNNDNTQHETLNHIDTPPPPPYPYESDFDSEDDEAQDDSTNDSDNEHEEARAPRCHHRQPPIKLMINAAHHVQGSGNVLPVSPNPLVDATRLSLTLANALGSIGTGQPAGNAATPAAATANSNSAVHQLRTRGLDITINCGVTVVGDRNMIGAIGLRKPIVPVGPVAPGVPPVGQGPDTAGSVPTANNSTLTSQTNGTLPTLQTNGSSGLTAGGMKRKVEDTGPANCESPTKKFAGDSEEDK